MRTQSTRSVPRKQNHHTQLLLYTCFSWERCCTWFQKCMFCYLLHGDCSWCLGSWLPSCSRICLRRLDLPSFTLCQIIPCDNWHEHIREVMMEYPWARTIFIVFWVIISVFVIMNFIEILLIQQLLHLHQHQLLHQLLPWISWQELAL